MYTAFSTTVLAFGALLTTPFWPAGAALAPSLGTAHAQTSGFGQINMPETFLPQLQSIQVQTEGESKIIGEAPAYVQKKYGADANLPVPNAPGGVQPTKASRDPLRTEPKPLLAPALSASKRAASVAGAAAQPTKKQPEQARPNPVKPQKMALAFTANQTVSTAQKNAMTAFVDILAKRPAKNRKHLFLTTHAPTPALETKATEVAQPVVKALREKRLLSGKNPLAVHELIFTQGPTKQGKLEVLVK